MEILCIKLFTKANVLLGAAGVDHLQRLAPLDARAGGSSFAGPRHTDDDEDLEWRKDTVTQSLVKMTVADNWTAGYTEEQSHFNSFALFSEVRLREAFRATEALGNPNTHRTAICADLLIKSCGLFGRYSDLMAILSKEIVRSCYDDFDDIYNGSETDVQRLFQGKPYHELVNGMRERMGMYKRRVVRLEERLGGSKAMVEKNARVMHVAITNWQKLLLQRVFWLWQYVCMSICPLFRTTYTSDGEISSPPLPSNTLTRRPHGSDCSATGTPPTR